MDSNMHVKVYSYRIRSTDFGKWKEITDAANERYREFGVRQSERMIQRNEEEMKIMEVEYYDSKEECKRIASQAERDERAIALFEEFTRLVVGDLLEEEYETA